MLFICRDRFAPRVIALSILLLLPNLIASSVQGNDDLSRGSTSRKSRRDAVSAIPFDKIKRAKRRQIQSIVDSASVYRRLPVTSISTDPDLHLFLVRHPEVVVDIWRLMGVSRMKASRVGQYLLRADDGAGTSSDIELVYGTSNCHVYLARGVYDGPLLMRKLSGSCVILLQTDYQRGADGQPHATSRLDIFMKVDNAAAGFIAKTVHPLFGTTADHNFVESMKFLEKLCDTTKENGPGVQGMAQRLTNVQPEIRQNFSDVVGTVFRRYSPEFQQVVPATGQPPRVISSTRWKGGNAQQSSFQQPVRRPRRQPTWQPHR